MERETESEKWLTREKDATLERKRKIWEERKIETYSSYFMRHLTDLKLCFPSDGSSLLISQGIQNIKAP